MIIKSVYKESYGATNIKMVGNFALGVFGSPYAL